MKTPLLAAHLYYTLPFSRPAVPGPAYTGWNKVAPRSGRADHITCRAQKKMKRQGPSQGQGELPPCPTSRCRAHLTLTLTFPVLASRSLPGAEGGSSLHQEVIGEARQGWGHRELGSRHLRTHLREVNQEVRPYVSRGSKQRLQVHAPRSHWASPTKHEFKITLFRMSRRQPQRAEP